MKSQVDLTFVDFMMLANHHVMLPCNLKAQAFVLLPKIGNEGIQVSVMTLVEFHGVLVKFQ